MQSPCYPFLVFKVFWIHERLNKFVVFCDKYATQKYFSSPIPFPHPSSHSGLSLFIIIFRYCGEHNLYVVIQINIIVYNYIDLNN